MPEKTAAPCGSWPSPISAAMVASAAVRLGEIILDGEDTWWLEGRPQEKGRSVLVKRSADGRQRDILPPPYNVRSRVHEYGGGSYTVRDGQVFFVQHDDQRMYRIAEGGLPRALTRESTVRYADLQVPEQPRWLICVMEDHDPTYTEPLNMLGRVDLDTGAVHPVVVGNDFYASPRISPDGSQLAWVTWDHPNMPWDSVELWVGDLTPEGEVTNPVLVAGGEGESVMQPLWWPDGTLSFLSDRSNWWNVYTWRGGETSAIAPMEAEFGYPSWVFGMSSYGLTRMGSLVTAAVEKGIWRLLEIDPRSGDVTEVETPYQTISSLKVEGNRAVFTGSSPLHTSRIVQLDLVTRELEVLRASSEPGVDPDSISLPEPIEFETENGETAHAFFYPPCSRTHRVPDGEKPPLLVMSHGGPTSATSSSLDMAIQYWTSRGFAVVDVNYRGSTGFGRVYRQRLYGRWGVADVDDCVHAALYLADRGDVDRDRMAIRGRSAGGYTTLAALTFRDVFKAGASYYGVSDLISLVEDTHKFESRYLDQLVGPFPECRDLYEARSPIYHVALLTTPVIFFQGLEDRVVPPSQALTMVNGLRRNGVPVAYLPFEGEQHGFRQAENIARALEAEYYFYGKIFGFDFPVEINPVEIENL